MRRLFVSLTGLTLLTAAVGCGHTGAMVAGGCATCGGGDAVVSGPAMPGEVVGQAMPASHTVIHAAQEPPMQ